jgi:mono/diheme cytochrome c family protein
VLNRAVKGKSSLEGRSPRKWLRWPGAAAAILALAAAGAIAWFLVRPGLPAIDPDDPAQVALGRLVYGTQCARCHGGRLEGQPNWRDRLPNGRLPAPPHDTSGHTWHHPDTQLFNITKHGLAPFVEPGYESDMPAFAGILTDGEIAAVLAYIKSTWPADIRAHQARISAQAE